jgi:hypothetical protein
MAAAFIIATSRQSFLFLLPLPLLQTLLFVSASAHAVPP